MNKAAQTTALDIQVGGAHYKTMRIQPVQFSLYNNLNAAQHSILKYLVRNKASDDLRKAAHFADLWNEIDTLQPGIECACLCRRNDLRLPMISIEVFVAANAIPAAVAEIMALFLETPSRERVAMAREKIAALEQQRFDNEIATSNAKPNQPKGKSCN